VGPSVPIPKLLDGFRVHLELGLYGSSSGHFVLTQVSLPDIQTHARTHARTLILAFISIDGLLKATETDHLTLCKNSASLFPTALPFPLTFPIPSIGNN
jgi:hypothetical protein